MNQSSKSATVAGILGIFLGAFGAHNWYLGQKKNGIIHVCLVGVGIGLEIAATVITATSGYLTVYRLAGLLTALTAIGGLLISASSIWGLIEGIVILSGGDAALAQKGYTVATPVQPMQGYGQPQPGYGQPMGQPMQGYGQSMQPAQPVPPAPNPAAPAPEPVQPAAPAEPVQPAPEQPVEPQQPTDQQ